MTHLPSCLMHCRAPVLHRARAHRARPALDSVGVGLDNAYRVERESELLGRDLSQRGLMTLTEGSGPAAHRRSPVRLDPDRSPFRADSDCRDLDIDRKADPELQTVAALAAPNLLGAQLPISGELEELVKCPLVLT